MSTPPRPTPLPTNRSVASINTGPFGLVDIDVYRTHSGDPFMYPFSVSRQELRLGVVFLIVQDAANKRVADAGFEGGYVSKIQQPARGCWILLT